MPLALRASLVVQLVKNLLAVHETRVRSLDWEDSLEKEMANPLQYPCLGHKESGTAEQLTVTYRRAPLTHDKIEQDVFLKCRP